MKRSDALKRLSDLKPELDKLGIKSLALFGSVARGRARPGSDIDLLVEFNHTPDLIEFAGVKLRLEELSICSRAAASALNSADGFSKRQFVPPRDWRLRLKDIEQSIDRIAISRVSTTRLSPAIGERWMLSSVTSRSSARPP